MTIDRAEAARQRRKHRTVESGREQERCKRCKGLFRYGTLDDDFLCADCAKVRATEKPQWEDVPLFDTPDEGATNDQARTEHH